MHYARSTLTSTCGPSLMDSLQMSGNLLKGENPVRMD